jgi:hypothetical protein
LLGVWLRIPPWGINVVIKTEEATAGRTILFKCRRLVEASEEVQDPQRTVEPKMMMMTRVHRATIQKITSEQSLLRKCQNL